MDSCLKDLVSMHETLPQNTVAAKPKEKKGIKKRRRKNYALFYWEVAQKLVPPKEKTPGWMICEFCGSNSTSPCLIR